MSRVLVVAAHPDDVDFGTGGSVAAFTEAGVEVAYCIVTDGQAGGEDRSMPRAEMAAVRRDEQRAAAAELGVDDVTYLGHPDGSLRPTGAVRRDITRVIRRFRPQRVIAPSPERRWDRIFASHPDHLAAGEASACAVYPDARNPFAHPELLEEGLEPHTVAELWLSNHPTANVVVETTATFERKMAALRRHASQLRDVGDATERLRGFAAETARTAGLPEGALAEAFLKVATV